jgi:hypothetical protein
MRIELHIVKNFRWLGCETAARKVRRWLDLKLDFVPLGRRQGFTAWQESVIG